VQDAIAFGEINYGFGSKGMDAKERRKSIAAIANRTVRRKSVFAGATNTSVDIEELTDELGTLSAPAAAKLNALEIENSELKAQLEELKKGEMKNMEEQMFTLKREKTMAQQETTRRKSVALADGDRLSGLSEKVKEQRKEISAMEKELLETKSALEEAQASGGSGSGGAATEEVMEQLAVVRKELLDARKQIAALKQDADKVDMSALKHINEEVKELVQLRKDLEFVPTDFLEMEISFKQLKEAFVKMMANNEGGNKELIKKYRAEVILRKQLYNQVQELRGNIRVFCRCRKDDRVKCALKFPSKTEMILNAMSGAATTVDFDATYGPETDQSTIFEDTKEVIMSVVDGYNVCLMAYGQTGAGKSFTMNGPKDNPGVNRRAIKKLLDLINESSETIQVEMFASIMEVYNENIFDLLAPEGRVKRDIKVGPQGAFVHELCERNITTAEECDQLTEDSDKNRSIASTSMNSESSRSHLLFQIRVDTTNKVSGMRSSAKLTLVDLAGSERIAKSEVTGDQLVEAAAINKSLSALGQVFQAISKGSPHIPFRNSKLTHVLQDSLGGDSKTCMFINVRPDDDNLSETWSTLNFGQNIRKIELGPAKSHKKKGGKPPPPPGAGKK
jgi:kinesin family protein C2/C3